jgi:hypothetical protein
VRVPSRLALSLHLGVVSALEGWDIWELEGYIWETIWTFGNYVDTFVFHSYIIQRKMRESSPYRTYTAGESNIWTIPNNTTNRHGRCWAELRGYSWENCLFWPD